MTNPTSGAGDGSLVSSSTETAPILSGNIKVPSTGYTEGSFVKLAARCSTGYITVEESTKYATLSIENAGSTDKWQLSLSTDSTLASDWGNPLNVTAAAISDVNTIFYARARVSSTEEPLNDSSIDIKISATIGAA